ncbi:MAG: methyltransferase domain-containing protein [Candidatus Micrarchaeia archaeon]
MDVQIPRAEIRAAAESISCLKPLIDTTDTERKIIAHFAVLGMENHWKDMIEDLDKLKSGEWKLRNLKTGQLEKATKEKIIEIYTDYEASKRKAFCTCIGNECEKSVGNSMKNRSLQMIFEENGMDFLAAAKTAIDAKKGRINALDVGCGDGTALYELKRGLGDKIVTRGLSLFQETQAPLDYSYHLSAEMMPDFFKGKFDLALSNKTIQYTALPHLVLANIAESLASKGKAMVGWMEGQFDTMYKTGVSASGIYEYYSRLLTNSISGTKARAIRKGRVVEGELLLHGSQYDKARSIARALSYHDINCLTALAYCAELSIINAMPEYRLTVEKYAGELLGELPEIITIERV